MNARRDAAIDPMPVMAAVKIGRLIAVEIRKPSEINGVLVTKRVLQQRLVFVLTGKKPLNRIVRVAKALLKIVRKVFLGEIPLSRSQDPVMDCCGFLPASPSSRTSHFTACGESESHEKSGSFSNQLSLLDL